LERQGYQVVGFSSGYRPTELENAEVFRRSPVRSATTIERLVLETSVLVLAETAAIQNGWIWEYPGHQAHRERVLFLLEELRLAPQFAGPKFVFAHILLPHPPFVFDAQGRPVYHDRPFTLMDGSAFSGSTGEYLQRYPDQVAFLNRELLRIVDQITANDARSSVIILQADHGSGVGLDWTSEARSDLDERSSILNAYRFPPGDQPTIYETISPVNTFRILFNHYFGTKLSRLEDRSYYSTWDRPFDLVEIELGGPP
jgi:hypothetical protein